MPSNPQQVPTTSGSDGNGRLNQTMVTPSSDALATVLEGEAILLNLGTGMYFTLNRMGTALWEKLSNGCTRSTLLSSLCAGGGVSRETAGKDLSSFLADLEQGGLIRQENR